MARTIAEDGTVIEDVVDPLVPVVGPETASALDELRNQLVVSDTGGDGAAADKPADEKPADEKPADEKPAEDKPADEKPADEKPVEDKPAPDKPTEDKPAGDKPTEDKPAGDKPTEDKPADQPADEFTKKLDEIQLPPHARPKSSEAFTLVKETARQEVVKIRAELEAERKARVELEARTKALVPKEEVDRLSAEIEDLRKFKLAQDIEQDPRLQEFDKKITENDDAILSKFLESGGKPEQVAKIKELGGPRKIDWEPLFKHMSLAQRRFIESKLVESEGVSYNKTKAVESAKADVGAWKKEYEQRRFSRADQEIAKADWLKPIPVNKDATPEERAAADAQNKRVAALNAKVKQALADTSPEMHAMLAVGTAMAHDLHWQLQQLVALREKETTALKEAHGKALETVTKERDALKTELDRLKNAAKGARPGSLAPGRAATRVAPTPGSFDLTKSTEESLDALARQVSQGS